MRLLSIVALVALCVLPAGAQAGSLDEPYGRARVTHVPFPLIMREWQGMPAKFRDDAELVWTCRANPDRCTPALQEVNNLMDELLCVNDWNKVSIVSRTVGNRIEYMTDMSQWGPTDLNRDGEQVSERWSSPLDTYMSRLGDCDDFANLEAFLLWMARMPLERMRMVIVDFDLQDAHELHVLLAVKVGPHDKWLALRPEFLEYAADMRARYVLEPYKIPGVSLVAQAQPPAH